MFLQYSTRQDLGGGMLVSDIKVAAVIGPVLLVTFTCMNVSRGVAGWYGLKDGTLGRRC